MRALCLLPLVFVGGLAGRDGDQLVLTVEVRGCEDVIVDSLDAELPEKVRQRLQLIVPLGRSFHSGCALGDCTFRISGTATLTEDRRLLLKYSTVLETPRDGSSASSTVMLRLNAPLRMSGSRSGESVSSEGKTRYRMSSRIIFAEFTLRRNTAL